LDDWEIIVVRLAIVLLSILGVAALVLVLIVIVMGIIATAHIEIISKKGPVGAHPVESLALLDQMRGPRPGGPRARRK
jgi:hypothetical protein